MKIFIQKLRKRVRKVNYREIIRYGIIGVLTQIVDLTTYAGFVLLGFHYLIADIANLPFLIAVNYIGHKFFTFEKPEWEKKEFGKYLLNLLFNYVYTTAILIVAVNLLGNEVIVGKIAQIIVVTLINYLILKRFVFVKN